MVIISLVFLVLSDNLYLKITKRLPIKYEGIVAKKHGFTTCDICQQSLSSQKKIPYTVTDNGAFLSLSKETADFLDSHRCHYRVDNKNDNWNDIIRMMMKALIIVQIPFTSNEHG